ncbi:hypothetical protein [Nostoc parmelioides]|uniref:Uncharacterized protein n=1 Tax=Nostoc parmelioides FACHB-3921 TaxID=2692909 RepID=A0ABR8BMR5_9NOSO|nr:hypothetical protein [Nostoc parmelioides]MBD2254959.1 hypothetical protein [Nostoc parmelioides FACHB-3921]
MPRRKRKYKVGLGKDINQLIKYSNRRPPRRSGLDYHPKYGEAFISIFLKLMFVLPVIFVIKFISFIVPLILTLVSTLLKSIFNKTDSNSVDKDKP